MDISHLHRDAAKVHGALKEINNSLIATRPCKIYVPEHYIGSPLGSIDTSIHIVGIFAITVDDKYYGVSKACALMQIEPSITNVVTIDNVKYMEFSFTTNDTVIKNLNLIRTGTLVYRIYNEFIAKGKEPWYISYADLCFLFDTAELHGNANLNANSALLELIATSMARQKEDRSKYFRLDPRLKDKHIDLKPIYIPLKSVAYNTSNTTAKLLGGYFNEGLTSALVMPSERNESIEDLLRT